MTKEVDANAYFVAAAQGAGGPQQKYAAVVVKSQVCPCCRKTATEHHRLAVAREDHIAFAAVLLAAGSLTTHLAERSTGQRYEAS